MHADVDPDGDVMVSGGQRTEHYWIMVRGGDLRFYAQNPILPDAAAAAATEAVNEVNSKRKLPRAALVQSGAGGMIVFDWYLPDGIAITPRDLVDAAQRFALAVDEARDFVAETVGAAGANHG